MSNSPIRVVHLCKFFSKLTETFIYDQVRSLDCQSFDNHVLTFHVLNPRTRPFAKTHIIKGPSWRNRLFYEFSRRIFKDHVRFLPMRRQTAVSLSTLVPDIIHAHFGPMAVLAAPIASTRRIPLVVTFYGFDLSKLGVEPEWRRNYGELWRSISRVIVLCPSMAELVEGLGCPRELIETVPVIRFIDEFPIAESSFPVRHFVSVGRFVEKKGHADTLRAFSEVRKDFPDVSLRIIGGGGTDLQVVLQLIKELNLQEAVHIHERMDNPDVLRCMAKADAFILSSKTATNGDQEGAPTSLLEAQAVGLPCISTWHAGIPTIIPRENHHLLTNEGDVPGIRAKMAFLMQSDRLAVAQIVGRGRNFVQTHFAMETQVRRLHRIYENSIVGLRSSSVNHVGLGLPGPTLQQRWLAHGSNKQ